MLKVNVTIPKKLHLIVSNMENVNTVVKDTLDLTFKKIKSLYSETHETWDHKPKFEFEREVGSNRIRYAYYTNDDIYRYVHDGTKAHAIHAKNPDKYPMAFPWAGFSGAHEAKTAPHIIGSWDSDTHATGTYFFYSVSHPGIHPRMFTKAIYEEVAPEMITDLKQALSSYGR